MLFVKYLLCLGGFFGNVKGCIFIKINFSLIYMGIINSSRVLELVYIVFCYKLIKM